MWPQAYFFLLNGGTMFRSMKGKADAIANVRCHVLHLYLLHNVSSDFARA
jgi:hypothetical protein